MRRLVVKFDNCSDIGNYMVDKATEWCVKTGDQHTLCVVGAAADHNGAIHCDDLVYMLRLWPR
jgi:hypothetical protein